MTSKSLLEVVHEFGHDRIMNGGYLPLPSVNSYSVLGRPQNYDFYVSNGILVIVEEDKRAVVIAGILKIDDSTYLKVGGIPVNNVVKIDDKDKFLEGFTYITSVRDRFFHVKSKGTDFSSLCAKIESMGQLYSKKI